MYGNRANALNRGRQQYDYSDCDAATNTKDCYHSRQQSFHSVRDMGIE